MNYEYNPLPETAALYQQYRDMYEQSQAASSASASTSMSPSADPPVKSKQKQRRLPQAASAILKEWFPAHDGKPTTAQKRAFVQRIHEEFPETRDWWTFQSLGRWINNRRRLDKEQAGRKDERKDTASLLWPSLDKDKINHLRTLRTQKPYNVPFEKVIPLWARALSVPEEHVEAWLKYNTEEDDDFVDERKPLLHLPTPEATASPEPSYSHMSNSPAAASPVLQPFSSMHSPIKQQQHSPVQPIFIHTTFPPSPLHSPLGRMRTPHTNGQPTPQATPPITYPHTPLEARPKMQITIPPQPQPSQSPETSPEPTSAPPVQALLNNLAVSITELKASGEADSVVINSIEDFDRAFEPYERIMHAILAKTQDGTFAPLGLVPSATSLLPQPADDGDFKIDIDSMQEQ